MLFSSVPFLFYFLPCVLLVYFLVPGTLKNGVLLLASLLFYGWGEPRYLLVMLAAIGMCSGLCMLPMALLLLRGAPPALRGRIMGMRTQAVYGLPLGLLVAGPLIERVGLPATATLYGVGGLACILLIAWRWRSHLWLPTAAGNRR